jgi:nucleotidyltransferase substrate binding protein (TIGR01987 family)
MSGLENKIDYFRSALDRLKESAKVDVTDSVIMDGVIQRFEFTFELAWKTLKAFMEYKGFSVPVSPRDILKDAYAAGIITDGDTFIKMLTDRNISSHTYDEEMAYELYGRIKDRYISIFSDLLEYIEKETNS